MIYVRIQTNRAKIKEILNLFPKNLLEDEKLTVSRPRPKETFNFYVGFGVVKMGSYNYNLLSGLKNFKEIHQEDYIRETNEIAFYWSV